MLYGWAIPAAEPYRLSRVVGERLAALSDRSGARPVLLAFQEPTVVYTMGRPATMLRTWSQLYDQLDRSGVVATAILDKDELAEFRGHREVSIEVHETVRGFNLNKGRAQTLHLALIRRSVVAKYNTSADDAEKRR